MWTISPNLSKVSRRTAEFAATETKEHNNIDKNQSECFDCGKIVHWRGDPSCNNPMKRDRYRINPKLKPNNEAHRSSRRWALCYQGRYYPSTLVNLYVDSTVSFQQKDDKEYSQTKQKKD